MNPEISRNGAAFGFYLRFEALHNPSADADVDKQILVFRRRRHFGTFENVPKWHRDGVVFPIAYLPNRVRLLRGDY